MIKKLTAFVVLTRLLLAGNDEENAAKRIHSHLLINDPLSALEDARGLLPLFPTSKLLRLAFMRALCEKGDEMEALREWKVLSEQHPELLTDRNCLEMLAWGVISKAETSNQLVIRLNSLIGAAMTRDAKAIPLILDQIRGSNGLLRTVAIQIAAELGDMPLQNEISRLLKEEKIWYARLEVIKAIGKLRLTKHRQDLIEIIGNPKTLVEEKAAAIVSFLSMYENIEDKELRNLIKSNRAGLRELSCEIIAHLDLYDKAHEIIPLLKDAHPGVRIGALNTFSLLGLKQVGDKPLLELIEPLINDPSVEVAITAAWLAYIHGEKKVEEKFTNWILSSEAKVRRLSSSALAACGNAGAKLCKKMLKKTEDPYVKVNLALGLIGQRKQIDLASDALYGVLMSGKQTLWMWEKESNPLFRSLGPSEIKHTEQIPNYPLVVDQMTKLELLSVLSVLRYPKAIDAVKGFLQNQTWGASGAAAMTLLKEGDDEAMELVSKLLEDPDEKLRIQAALILALFGSDKAAVKVLKEAYPSSSREMKVHILEALGKIGDQECIPFLLEIFSEPFQVLRVVAATALIQCLYH
ncbi:MAG TPA: HEAT repeat domain-containing protein [Rhabdochlamydiaceae bacterium]|nr:HEAT repeat domain-containing protein [Rhabdochlamydiaceae bacterium]